MGDTGRRRGNHCCRRRIASPGGWRARAEARPIPARPAWTDRFATTVSVPITPTALLDPALTALVEAYASHAFQHCPGRTSPASAFTLGAWQVTFAPPRGARPPHPPP